VERSPSLDLLLPRAEHSAVLAYAQAHRDGFPGEAVRAEEALDQLQSDVAQSERSAWDAWDGAHPDEAADAPHQLLALLAAGDAEKSADPERAVRAQDALFPPTLLLAQLEPAEQGAEAEPYRPDVVRSEEQSCGAQVLAAWQQPAERLDAARSELREQQAMQRPSWRALQVQVELPQLRAALWGELVAQLLPGPQVVQATRQERQASQPLAARPRVAQQERAAAERKPKLAGRAEPRPGQAWPAEPRLLASAQRPAARGAAARAQRPLPSSA